MLQVDNIDEADVVRLGEDEIPHAALGVPLPANPRQLIAVVERDGVIIASKTLTLNAGEQRKVQLVVPVRMAPMAPAPTTAEAGSAGEPTPVVEGEKSAPTAAEPVASEGLSFPFLAAGGAAVLLVGAAAAIAGAGLLGFGVYTHLQLDQAIRDAEGGVGALTQTDAPSPAGAGRPV